MCRARRRTPARSRSTRRSSRRATTPSAWSGATSPATRLTRRARSRSGASRRSRLRRPRIRPARTHMRPRSAATRVLHRGRAAIGDKGTWTGSGTSAKLSVAALRCERPVVRRHSRCNVVDLRDHGRGRGPQARLLRDRVEHRRDHDAMLAGKCAGAGRRGSRWRSGRARQVPVDGRHDQRWVPRPDRQHRRGSQLRTGRSSDPRAEGTNNTSSTTITTHSTTVTTTDRGAVNGTNGADRAKLSAFVNSRFSVQKVGFGKRAVITGRLECTSGSPIADAVLVVQQRFAQPTAAMTTVGKLVTGGGWSLHLHRASGAVADDPLRISVPRRRCRLRGHD